MRVAEGAAPPSLSAATTAVPTSRSAAKIALACPREKRRVVRQSALIRDPLADVASRDAKSARVLTARTLAVSPGANRTRLAMNCGNPTAISARPCGLDRPRNSLACRRPPLLQVDVEVLPIAREDHRTEAVHPRM